jgi:predicted deacetylase
MGSRIRSPLSPVPGDPGFLMLLVSIHDVTPALESGVLQLWDLCSTQGITPALFVVPNWHGHWPLEQHPRFVSWLHDRAGEGTELVLHGERHDEVGLPRSPRDRWRAWGKTKAEGEFLTLDATEASIRLRRGLESLLALGLRPTGFVPPAWLIREDAIASAGALGLSFTEDASSIRLLPSGKRLPSPVVRWSARTPTRAWISVAVAGARWCLQRRTQCPRIALHPQDLQHRTVRRSQAGTLQRWLSRHPPARYADLVSTGLPA